MLKPVNRNFRGLITISGPTKSGKSQLAEFLISEQSSITYIATSKPRENDPDWQRRIKIHKLRRPKEWNFLEYPLDICKSIESLPLTESILLDSLGGLVEQYLNKNDYFWNLFKDKFINCIIKNNYGIFVVSEEIGWGLVPPTPIGYLFRERHCDFYSLLCRNATKKWLAVNGTAIDLDNIGESIP